MLPPRRLSTSTAFSVVWAAIAMGPGGSRRSASANTPAFVCPCRRLPPRSFTAEPSATAGPASRTASGYRISFAPQPASRAWGAKRHGGTRVAWSPRFLAKERPVVARPITEWRCALVYKLRPRGRCLTANRGHLYNSPATRRVIYVHFLASTDFLGTWHSSRFDLSDIDLAGESVCPALFSC